MGQFHYVLFGRDIIGAKGRVDFQSKLDNFILLLAGNDKWIYMEEPGIYRKFDKALFTNLLGRLLGS